MAEITTVIGAESLVKGRIAGDEDVLVEGRVEGQIALSKTLYVEASGIVVADVNVDQAVIGGTVVGDVHARTAVQVTATGRVVGQVSAPRIVVSEGARLRASLDTAQQPASGAGSAARPAAPGAAAPAWRPAPAAPAAGSSVVGQALAARPTLASALEEEKKKTSR
jgi:cytoskeletal protein CcmA (bactofilin family)